jgi:hypothetical protein
MITSAFEREELKSTMIRNLMFASLCATLTAVAAIQPSTAVSQQGGELETTATSSMPAYPLKLSANHRYLVDQKNKPFLIVGDTPQGLMGMLSEQEVEEYFADRQAHGFNAAGWIDVACAGRDFPDNPTGATYDGILPFTGYLAGGTDFAHFDLSKPNEAYFVRLDHAIESAARHGIFVFIDPAETIGWLPVLRNNGAAAAYAYGQFLGRRYKKYANVAWISGNDFNRWRVPTDDALALAVAKGIQSAAPEQLQTIELNVATSSSLDDQSWAPIISLNSTYTYSATYIQMLHSYNQTPVLPDYLVEARYDLEQGESQTDYGTPEMVRREEYWTMLSGGTGQIYGNHYSWSFSHGWKSYIDTLAVTQLEIWKDFFGSLPWQDLVPDQGHSVLTAGYGTFGSTDVKLDPVHYITNMEPRVNTSDYATAAGTPDGRFVVVYMPTERRITVNMASLKGSATARWFDPTDGTYQSIPGGPFLNTGSQQFTPPGKNHARDGDWVLLLNASGSSTK